MATILFGLPPSPQARAEAEDEKEAEISNASPELPGVGAKMNIKQPEQLAGYKREKSAESKVLVLSRILGAIVLGGFIGTPVSFFLGRPEAGIVSLVLCSASAVGLILLQNKKTVRKCPSCRNPMDVLDVDWPSSDYTGAKRKYPGIIAGADGNIYYARSRGSTARGADRLVIYTIERFVQRWSACHNCKLCFLSAEVAREKDEMFKAQDSKKWKRAQELIKSDPEAVEGRKIFHL